MSVPNCFYRGRGFTPAPVRVQKQTFMLRGSNCIVESSFSLSSEARHFGPAPKTDLFRNLPALIVFL